MIKPEMQGLLNESGSVFSLVIAVAKRSRDIAERANESHVELLDKPVNIAVKELVDYKIRVVEPENQM